jgi:L-fuconolactonase
VTRSPRIDAHHHVWDPSTTSYPWLTGALAPIARAFDLEDYRPEAATAAIDGSVLVQTRSSIDETERFLGLAAGDDLVWGVVGWVDLTSPTVGDDLARLAARPDGRYLVGVRHQVEDEPDPDWLRRPDVRRGLRAVAGAGLVYDLLVRPQHLPAALTVVREHPGLSFVVDHIAKPDIAGAAWEPWAGGIAALAREPNVTCKLSGMVVLADWGRWTVADLRPYVRHCLEAFGPSRVMFGSDWPVCLLAGSLATVHRALVAALPDDPALLDRVLGGTAMRVYGLRNPAAPDA